MESMARYEEWLIRPKWFEAATPDSPHKASAVLVFSEPVADEDTVTIGDEVYEFDIDDNITATNIKVDVSDYLNHATNTLTFTGNAGDGELLTIDDGVTEEVYKFLNVLTEGNDSIEVLIDTEGIAGTIANLVDAMAESEIVDAKINEDEDAVIITAKAKGTTGNSYTVVTTCTNGKFENGTQDDTLAGGLDTVVEKDAAEALVSVIKDKSEIVTAVQDSENEKKVFVECKNIGTEGNDITISTAASTRIAWDKGAAKLSGGKYGTPCPMRGLVVVDVVSKVEHYYVCTKPGGKSNVEWKTFTLSGLYDT